MSGIRTLDSLALIFPFLVLGSSALRDEVFLDRTETLPRVYDSNLPRKYINKKGHVQSYRTGRNHRG